MTQKNGEMRYLELQINSIIINYEEHHIGTFRDVTENRRLQQAEGNAKLGSMLMSSVTHEMVTPLKCIISFAQSLEQELKHSPKRADAELIYITGKLLLSQIKLLLDRSLIENGAFTPSFEFTPVNRIINDCTRILKQQAQVKEITIVMKPMRKELILKIDPLRVQQVVINFLSNAIKFSPEGSQITVKVKNVVD